MKSSPQCPHMSSRKTSFVNWPDALEQLKEGNRDAFFFIYEGYHAKLYAYILKFVKAPAFAEDILQEVFLKIWEHRLKINPSLSFNAYVYKICRNTLFDYIKKMAADKEVKSVLIQHMAESDDAADARLLSRQYDVVLNLAVKRLPAQRRNVFRLCRQEGKKYEEVAEILQISKNTVKEHMVMAVKSIREYVANNTDFPMSVFLVLWIIS